MYVCVRSNTPIYVKPYFMSWLHQLKIECVTGPVVNLTQVNMIHKRLLTHIWLTKAHTQIENTVTGCHRMVTTWFWKNDLNILTRNSRVRPMSRIDLTPAETTAMGVLPSSVRSALMSRPGGKSHDIKLLTRTRCHHDSFGVLTHGEHPSLGGPAFLWPFLDPTICVTGGHLTSRSLSSCFC